VADVFISYKREDVDAASAVAKAMQRIGLDVFFDAAINVGEQWDERIERELNTARSIIVLWSTRSRDSQWVRNEARIGLRRSILFPCLVEQCEVPVEFSGVQNFDLTNNSADNLARLVADFISDGAR
jgi:hypothetical protein